MNRSDIYNFSPGPCTLPEEVLKIAQEELLNWHGSGVSVMEMSHRGKEFVQIYDKCEADMRKLLDIPENFKILFFQGGATLQFTMIAKNLLGKNRKANYLVTGNWSEKALQDAALVGDINRVIKCTDFAYTGCPDVEEWKVDEDVSYFYYCDNETVVGVEFNEFPFEKYKNQTLVGDMSSNFCTRKVDWTKYGVVFAGAQKNLGPAGLCITIVREDLIGNHQDDTGSYLNWELTGKCGQNMYNTPNGWAIYMVGLNMTYMLEKGLDKIEEESKAKSDLIYNLIDSSEGYFMNPIDTKYRSRINVPFRIKEDEALEAKFISEAESAGFLRLKNHGFVKGCRVSIYNAMPIEGVEALVEFMKIFRENNP